MILGMSLSTFTLVHVLLSLVGIVSGLLVAYGMLLGKRFDGATAIFLTTTILTSVSGFLFPFERLLPSHVVGIISLIALAIAVVARYPLHMARAWRSIYVINAVLALYLNVFVLIAQIFMKVPAAHALAPNGNEPPAVITQLVVLVIFVVLGIQAVRKFRPEAAVDAPTWTKTKAS